MQGVLLIGLGSALGGMARYGLGLVATALWGSTFPWGTLIINGLGSFVIGLFNTATLPEARFPVHADMRLFVMVGLCGGFTTFSSFSLQTLSLMQEGEWGRAAANVLLSVALCLAAVWAGHAAGALLDAPGGAGTL